MSPFCREKRVAFPTADGILYQMSGSTEVSIGGEAKTLSPGEGMFLAGGKLASMKTGTGEASTLLHFLLVPVADQDQPVETNPAIVKELYRTAAPISDLKPGSYDLNLTRVTFPAQMPSNPHIIGRERLFTTLSLERGLIPSMAKRTQRDQAL